MRKVILAIAAALIVVGAFVAIYFQPQKLWVDDTVNEAAPAAPAQQTAKNLTGNFRSLNHNGSGTATVLTSADGSKTLRFENFDVENGPDLYVYLSNADANSTDSDNFGEDFVDLGKLKGNKGFQNYAIPPSTDLSKYSNAVIWCKRFSSGFAVAPLA